MNGFLHEPQQANGRGLVLTHGAGANCRSPLLLAVAEAFCAEGWHVLRCDLAFRQAKPSGPPHPAYAARDREGLRSAAEELRKLAPDFLVLGGHSYGGRQASMLLAEDPSVAEALLALSYPLHPPKQPEKMRTGHWGQISTPCVFVHGTADPFGSVTEMEEALPMITAKRLLSAVEGAGHELKRGKFDVKAQAITPLQGILNI